MREKLVWGAVVLPSFVGAGGFLGVAKQVIVFGLILLIVLFSYIRGLASYVTYTRAMRNAVP
jgi:hypothetical protein